MGGGSQDCSYPQKRRCSSPGCSEQVPPKKRMRMEVIQQLVDVPELIQRIQLELSPQDAARTCILSKSWLHAWSTTPAIRLHCPTRSCFLKENQNQRKYLRCIYLTLLRYHRHNLPITSLDLELGLHATNHPAARKLIKQAMIINPCLKHLRLAILAASFDLPNEIFLNQYLDTLTLDCITPYQNYRHSLHFRDSLPIIRCTNLRVLVLSYVHITPYLLSELLSMNKLLETIFLGVTPGLNEIKVSSLRYLRVFEVCLGTDAWIDILEIHDAPSLRSLVFKAPMSMWDIPPSSFEIRTIGGGSLTKLRLDNVHIDDAFSNMIRSSFPFLEDLSLKIRSSSQILNITCLTLRRLMLFFSSPDEEIKVQVYAPNLLAYTHGSSTVPILLFTTTPPEQIDLIFSPLGISINESFFLKMREALKLSTKFNIEMSGFRFGVSDLFNVDDVKTIVSHPATNVEQLLLEEVYTDNEEDSLLLDAVFSICHPMYAKTNDELRLKVADYFLKLILKGVMENCEIKNPLDGTWVALTSSSLTLLDTTTPQGLYEFKLSW